MDKSSAKDWGNPDPHQWGRRWARISSRRSGSSPLTAPSGRIFCVSFLFQMSLMWGRGGVSVKHSL